MHYNLQKGDWKKELVGINEALQHLTKQKDKSNNAMLKFKSNSHNAGKVVHERVLTTFQERGTKDTELVHVLLYDIFVRYFRVISQ